MHIRSEQLALRLEKPFKLSYGATDVRHNVLVHIDDGIGEAAVVPYYGETPERIIAYVENLTLDGDPLLLHDLLDHLPPAPSPAARGAVDIALHDLWGKALGQPLYRLWGLNPGHCPVSSYTVAMADDEAEYRERLHQARSYPLVKLKLGSGSTDEDLRRVRIAREELDAADLCVDANGGWSADEAVQMIAELGDLMFIEQPVARDDMDGWRKLQTITPRPPLIADESVQGVESMTALAGLVDGVNIKLAKSGGLAPARQMIALARAYGMQVLVGCMIESSIAVTAAAHLAPLADYADLDGNLLITNDPCTGVKLDDRKRLVLPDGPGLGLIC